MLIQNGCNVNAKNSNGETVLYCAVKNGALKFAKVLIALSADVNVTNNKNVTLLDIVSTGNREELDSLIK